MSTIKELINIITSGNEKHLENAVMELCDFVKTFEGEEQLLPVEEVLPELAELLYHKKDMINGSAISIFRRVEINKRTIKKLLQLNKTAPNSLVVEALSCVGDEYWNVEIEQEIVRAIELETTEYVAIRALYEKVYSIEQTETLDALKNVLESKEKEPARIAINTLCILSNFNHKTEANKILQDFITNSSRENLKEEIMRKLNI